jgi:hypothetical protein
MARRKPQPSKKRKINHRVVLGYIAAITALIVAITGLLTVILQAPKLPLGHRRLIPARSRRSKGFRSLPVRTVAPAQKCLAGAKIIEKGAQKLRPYNRCRVSPRVTY